MCTPHFLKLLVLVNVEALGTKMKLIIVTVIVMLYSLVGETHAFRLPTRLPLSRHRGDVASYFIKSSVPLGTRTELAMVNTNESNGDEDKVILGVQAKYFYAVCVMLFAFAYDFFVTHNGFKDGWVP